MKTIDEFRRNLKQQIEAKFGLPSRVHCTITAYADCLSMWPKMNIKIDPLMTDYYSILAFSQFDAAKMKIDFNKAQYEFATK